MKKNMVSLPETITVPRTDPIYNCHSYLTKVPVGAIKPFIEEFTQPGDLVVDFFAGSGMTGLSALLLGRNASLSDISVLGQHIALGFLQNVSASEIRVSADSVIEAARNAIGDLYETERATDKNKQDMIRTVWSFSYICPSCGKEMVYFDHLDENGKAPTTCPFCPETFVKRKWSRGNHVPVRVVVKGENGKQAEQRIAQYDTDRIMRAARDDRQTKVPSLPIEQTREMYSRSGLGKSGMTDTGKFFSPRNAIALLELWQAIDTVDDARIKQKLRFVFTAILPRASMRYQWGPKRPLNAQNQTYYIAPVYYEWNVFDLFSRKANAAIRANNALFGPKTLFNRQEQGEVTYTLASADNLSHLEDSSVDYIFTDPPFGSNIFYSDMSLFHEAWLGKTTNHESEAVVYTTGKRRKGAEERYENLLRGSFEEAWRVLKPGKHMSVVFGNSRGNIWGLVQRALRHAGFRSAPCHVAILDKGQRSVKGLNSGSESVVTVDLVMTLQKPLKNEPASDVSIPTEDDKTKLIEEAILEQSSSEMINPSHVYARILRKAIQENMALDNLHLSDVLISLRNTGYAIDRKSGKLAIHQ